MEDEDRGAVDYVTGGEVAVAVDDEVDLLVIAGCGTAKLFLAR